MKVSTPRVDTMPKSFSLLSHDMLQIRQGGGGLSLFGLVMVYSSSAVFAAASTA